MPTWVSTATADDEDDGIGFMGGVLSRARKVLFTDVDVEDNINNIENNNNNNQKPSSVVVVVDEGKKKKKKKTKSRRVRLAAANSSLVNVTSIEKSDVDGGISNKESRVGDEGQVAAAAAIPPVKQGGISKRGGNSLKMDSLASATAAAAITTNTKLSSPTKLQPMALSIGSGGSKGLINVHAHRRSKSRSSLQQSQSDGLLLSVCGGSEEHQGNINNIISKKKSVKAKKQSEQKYDSNNELNTSSATCSLMDIDTSFTTSSKTCGLDIHQRKNKNINRRKGGGRCKQHPISSMVQRNCNNSSVGGGEETMAKSKRSSGAGLLSSLMALPASTQKTQKSTSSVVALPQKKRVTEKKKEVNSQKVQQQTTSNSTDDAFNITSLIESLRIDDCNQHQPQPNPQPQPQQQIMDCSTPLTIRRRLVQPGVITSPPQFLHRFPTQSNLSSPLFPDRTPRSDSNPNMTKRFDSKKTPITMKQPTPEVTSPSPQIVAQMAISPRIGADSLTSPRFSTTSSSFIISSSSPTIHEGNVLSETKSNLFSSSSADGQIAIPTETEEKNSLPLKSPVRGSSVLEVELATALKERRNASADAILPRNTRCQNQTKKEEKKPTKSVAIKTVDFPPLPLNVAAKEDNNVNAAEPTRRSTRQSKPTDRLTVVTWKNKKKKSTDRERTVTFDNVVKLNEEVKDEVNGEEQEEEEQEEEESLLPARKFQVSAANTKEKVISPKQTAKCSTSKKTVAPLAGAENRGDGEWTDTEVSMLRNAQKNIHPTSTLYWQEVAVQVGTKSSSECQIKWQSMVATPKLVRKATKKNDTKSGKGELDVSISYDDGDEEDEDDLFSSTPYRKAKEEEDIIVSKFGSFENAAGLSCKKQSTNAILAKQEEEQPSALKFRRKGYNTYIENLRKDINRVEKNKKKNSKQRSHHNANKQIVHSNIHANLGIGEMSGKLLSNGTIKISMQDDDELEEDDIWGEYGEEGDDDEDDIFYST